MDRDLVLRVIGELQKSITSRFCIKPKYEKLQPRAPRFDRIGPLGTVENLEVVLWYCELILRHAEDTRALQWIAAAPKIRIWFGFVCGLAAAEGMLPADAEMLQLLLPPKELQEAVKSQELLTAAE